MSLVPEFGPPVDDKDLAAGLEIVHRAFGGQQWTRTSWLNDLGEELFRILREKETPVAALCYIPAGQWFGGRVVSMAGIGAVGVLPEYWGRGAGSRLMQRTLKELREGGFCLSTLYPATLTLYRKAGYECAGGLYRIETRPDRIGVVERELSLRPLDKADEPRVEQLYRSYASRFSGLVDRHPFHWLHIRRDGTEDRWGYGVEVDGELEGYLYMNTRSSPEVEGNDVFLSDLVFTSARAGRRLLGFLADHRSQVRSIRWRGSPGDPMLTLFPEQKYRVQLVEHWMLRVVDVARALEARGYPPGLSARLELEVRDDVLPENEGRFVLDVSEGRAAVKPGGSGAFSLDVRALSQVYTGHLAPEVLRMTGRLQASDADVVTAAGLFAGPAPWMVDEF